MKLKKMSNFLRFEMGQLRPRWEEETGLTIFCGGGGLFVFEKYDHFYDSTKQSAVTGVNIGVCVAMEPNHAISISGH
ncbi:hypothetical protein [Bacillus pseudomycoides]|uniref:hypothetical protein n=1 Tax=Bacillus pseudomycoides TaxID=64104 RepID=UPI00285315A7|nr:hypothetical protein [Bacillus pseudomycoides]MDR4919000.1 hypothetical protein [Bacillus pseudomycoides]